MCIVSILRLGLTHHFAHKGLVTSKSHAKFGSDILINSAESGTYALLWSTIEVNVAIICASLLVMKPLIARFVPDLVSEQTASAREDARLWRVTTGIGLLDGSVADEEKARDEGRRDTAVSMSTRFPKRIVMPARTRGSRGRMRAWTW